MDSTLLKGLDILERAIFADAPVTVTELARNTGLPKSNIHRTLTTLTASGYLQHDPVARHYVPSLKLVSLGQRVSAHFPYRDALMPYLETLARESGETAAFMLPTPSGMVVMAAALPGRSPAAILTENSRFDPADTAFGTALTTRDGVALLAEHPERHTFELAIRFGAGDAPALGAIGILGPASRFRPEDRPRHLALLERERDRALAAIRGDTAC